jgi:hypothetical protein
MPKAQSWVYSLGEKRRGPPCSLGASLIFMYIYSFLFVNQ